MAFNARDIGRSIRNQANQALDSVKADARASVQNFVGDRLNTGIGFVDNFIGNAVGRAFDGFTSSFGFGKSARSGNLPNATKGKVKTPTLARFSTTSVESDWRVKLSVPDKIAGSPLLEPMRKTGNHMIFPYTPTIIISHSSNYNSLNPVHTNYPFQIYENSQSDDITITGEFIVENAAEGQYWVAVIHYLRTMTKMFYGTDGAPPLACRLSGYGDYVFNNVPVVISNFTVDLPSDVDYIAVPLSVNIGEDEDGAPISNSGTTWAPTASQISVTLKPTYSRRRVSTFNLNDFVEGKYINGGEGFI